MPSGVPRLACKEHDFKAKDREEMKVHREEHHKRAPRGTGNGALKVVPDHLKGTEIGAALEILMEQRKVNADEVAKIDRGIAGILANSPGA